MNEVQLEPRVVAMIVAQDAFNDVHGRTHVYAIFDNIVAPAFPVVTSFMVFAAFKGTKQGTHQAMIKIVDSLGNVLAQTEQLPFEISEYKGHNWFAKFGMRFPSPQMYRIQLFVDGIQRLEVPLMARQAELAPPKSA
jgi:hypothetical protein